MKNLQDMNVSLALGHISPNANDDVVKGPALGLQEQYPQIDHV